LGKQRVEAWQILKILLQLRETPNAKIPWMNHPAVRMWKNYENCLIQYGCEICREWIARGYKDSILEKLQSIIFTKEDIMIKNPPWLGDEKFHLAMKSNLIRKNPAHYRPIFGLDIPDNLPYHWIK
jgi:hypothetical protein